MVYYCVAYRSSAEDLRALGHCAWWVNGLIFYSDQIYVNHNLQMTMLGLYYAVLFLHKCLSSSLACGSPVVN